MHFRIVKAVFSFKYVFIFLDLNVLLGFSITVFYIKIKSR